MLVQAILALIRGGGEAGGCIGRIRLPYSAQSEVPHREAEVERVLTQIACHVVIAESM